MAERPRAAVIYDCLYPFSAGGGERVYRRVAEVLVDRGFDVDYLTRRQWEAATPEARFAVREVWAGDIYDSDGTRTLRGALAFGRAVRRELHREPAYDVVIASALPVLTLLAAASAIDRRRTFLVGDWLEVWPARKWRAYSGAVTGTVAFMLQTVAARCTANHTVNSRFTAERLRRVRGGVDPIVLGLVDLVDEVPTVVRKLDGPARILFVGRHIADKRLPALPAAFQLVLVRYPGATLTIVGTGPETEAARQAAVVAGVEHRVDFVGRVSDAELERLFASSAVLVNPSAREGFGLVVAEAAAHGTPSVVVAGEDNAAVELVEDGANGFVAASIQASDLAAGIIAAIEGGSALRRTTAEWFARERQERGLGASVDRLLERWRAAAR